MNMTRLSIILVVVAMVLLAAVPQLRQSLWGTYLIFLLDRPPSAIWLNKPHGEKLSRQYSRDGKVWLGFAEVRADRQPIRTASDNDHIVTPNHFRLLVV